MEFDIRSERNYCVSPGKDGKPSEKKQAQSPASFIRSYIRRWPLHRCRRKQTYFHAMKMAFVYFLPAVHDHAILHLGDV